VLGRDGVTVCFFGDGAANQGVLLESLNLSAIWSLPVIYLCENNHYTEWMRTEDITAGTIADRAKPFGVPGIQVDGNDVLAVREVAAEAVERARRGEGPTLIEADTYRQHAHNEGEEAFSGPYRPEQEMDSWRARDPIPRYRKHLVETGIASDDELDALEGQETEVIEAALRFAKESPMPPDDAALDDLFAETEAA
jgi:pyruvate dehydrogenase E1 component alpha subunit